MIAPGKHESFVTHSDEVDIDIRSYKLHSFSLCSALDAQLFYTPLGQKIVENDPGYKDRSKHVCSQTEKESNRKTPSRDRSEPVENQRRIALVTFASTIVMVARWYPVSIAARGVLPSRIPRVFVRISERLHQRRSLW